MIRIRCPFCGLRDHSEFSYEGDATVAYPALDASE
ncbi:MAG: sarcosine oxidase subunit delta, partial [Pseudomonadota bacterium]